MDNSEVYDLKKLKWVFWGMVIPMFANAASNFLGNAIVVKIICLVIELIGFIILILGLKGISRYSLGFKKAYDYVLFSMMLMVALIIGFFISVISSIILTLMVFITTIAVFAIIGLQICFYYSLLRGIREISTQLGEDKFAERIEKFWYIFIWTAIISTFSMFFITIAFQQLFVILTLIVVIALVIVHIMLYVYIFKAYKLLNGREIPKCTFSEDAVTKDSATFDKVLLEENERARE